MKRIYLAGPEVFLRNAIAVGEAKKAICRRHGLEGVFPLDNDLDLSNLARNEVASRISTANEDLMLTCDILIANMTPFRSPSMDVGTAFEMGFVRALGRPVLGYTNAGGTLFERTRRHFGGSLQSREDDNRLVEDPDGLLVEDFGLVDNLMLDGAVSSSGMKVVVSPAAPQQQFTHLKGFELCVLEAASFPS